MLASRIKEMCHLETLSLRIDNLSKVDLSILAENLSDLKMLKKFSFDGGDVTHIPEKFIEQISILGERLE
jgi:hypothetical protein